MPWYNVIDYWCMMLNLLSAHLKVLHSHVKKRKKKECKQFEGRLFCNAFKCALAVGFNITCQLSVLDLDLEKKLLSAFHITII